jgi:hypothetical protein
MVQIVRCRSVTAWPEFDPRPAHMRVVVEKCTGTVHICSS